MTFRGKVRTGKKIRQTDVELFELAFVEQCLKEYFGHTRILGLGMPMMLVHLSARVTSLSKDEGNRTDRIMLPTSCREMKSCGDHVLSSCPPLWPSFSSFHGPFKVSLTSRKQAGGRTDGEQNREQALSLLLLRKVQISPDSVYIIRPRV